MTGKEKSRATTGNGKHKRYFKDTKFGVISVETKIEQPYIGFDIFYTQFGKERRRTALFRNWNLLQYIIANPELLKTFVLNLISSENTGGRHNG